MSSPRALKVFTKEQYSRRHAMPTQPSRHSYPANSSMKTRKVVWRKPRELYPGKQAISYEWGGVIQKGKRGGA